jgi:hypothetical protein
MKSTGNESLRNEHQSCRELKLHTAANDESFGDKSGVGPAEFRRVSGVSGAKQPPIAHRCLIGWNLRGQGSP